MTHYINTTFFIETSLRSDFMAWAREYIALMPLDMGCEFCEITSPTQDGVESFAIRISGPDLSALEGWHGGAGENKRTELRKTFGEKALDFTSVMKEVCL